MPFESHSEFHAPDDSATIWRYMDLGKFLSLLDRSSLYFSRVDKLVDADPFEGYYTNVDLLTDKLNFDQMSDEWRERTKYKGREYIQELRRRKSFDP